ncbi:MAG: hypothetical protein J5900_05415 [Prevotella sp.]|nr:hypothetical protein [Prevotella sp.]MBQ8116268.1 hypothetical protein [Prevotella sp.]
MRKTLYNLLAAAAVLLASSCGADVVGEYTNHQAYFYMDFSYGHTATYLSEALNSTNVFTVITASDASRNAPYTLSCEMYGVSKKSETISESILTQAPRQLGIDNRGLIVGRSSFQDGQLYVFDRQCPNCWNANNYGNYLLSFSDAHNMVCNTCHRTYGLLNGGVVVSGDSGEKLFRYRASYSNQLFRVQNPQ